MKKLLIALALCSITGLSAQTQTKHEKMLKLIHLMKTDEMIDKTFQNMPAMLMQNVVPQAKDSATQRKAKAFMESSMNIVRDMTKQLINVDMVALYEKYFTDADIESYIRFYESPAGKKLVEMQPAMQQDIMKVMTTKYIPEMKAKMEAKMKELKDEEKK